MKTLNEHIKESLLDDEELISNDDDILIDRFLKDNYKISGTYTIDNGIVNINGSISVYNDDLKYLTNDIFKFGKVTGNFDCYGADLITLKGSPDIVEGNFNCGYCNYITSLEGSPNYVKGSFVCNDCKNLKTLKGIPKTIRASFHCEHCPKLDSIQLAYKVTKGNVYS